ncbi:hypothetical protein VCV18_002739 [Metarhizium anisopliae]
MLEYLHWRTDPMDRCFKVSEQRVCGRPKINLRCWKQKITIAELLLYNIWETLMPSFRTGSGFRQ